MLAGDVAELERRIEQRDVRQRPRQVEFRAGIAFDFQPSVDFHHVNDRLAEGSRITDTGKNLVHVNTTVGSVRVTQTNPRENLHARSRAEV